MIKCTLPDSARAPVKGLRVGISGGLIRARAFRAPAPMRPPAQPIRTFPFATLSHRVRSKLADTPNGAVRTRACGGSADAGNTARMAARGAYNA
eukprot:9500794-Pyramimonas_sp.AAC.1